MTRFLLHDTVLMSSSDGWVRLMLRVNITDNCLRGMKEDDQFKPISVLDPN